MAEDAGTITIDGKPYPMPGGDLTLGEMRLIKRVYGSMPDLTDAKMYLDPDVLIALAMIAKERAGESMSELQAEAIPLDAFFDEPAAASGEGVAVPPPVPVAASPPGAPVAAGPSPTMAILHAAGGTSGS
jgi:hypothetical protein